MSLIILLFAVGLILLAALIINVYAQVLKEKQSDLD